MATQTVQKENPLVERMFEAGAHFAYTKSRRHPSTAKYIFGAKNRTEIFDLEKVVSLLEDAGGFLEKLGTEGKTVLFVGGKNEARAVVEKTATELDQPYVASRWIGGTLTNFPEIKKRIGKLIELREARDKGELAKKYTKREILEVDRDIERLENNFGGLVTLQQLPAALVVVDPKHESIAVSEAQALNIPIVAVANSDCNISNIAYPIVGNDTNMASITFFLQFLAERYTRGRTTRPATPETTEENEADAAASSAA